MSGLDSLYAMLAPTTKSVLNLKRVVNQVSAATGNAPDSHETPQSQLPPPSQAKVNERRRANNVKLNRKRRASDLQKSLRQRRIGEITDDAAEIDSDLNTQLHIIDIEV